MRTRLERGGRGWPGWWVPAAAAATLLAACADGGSPTEVVEAPAVSAEEAIGGPHPPGEELGCVQQVPFLTLDETGSEVFYTAPAVGCVTRINHGRRTMTVDFVLPDGVPRPGGNIQLRPADTSWMCPVPGYQETYLLTRDFHLRVQADGAVTGRCVHVQD